jgi:hypothetical protein
MILVLLERSRPSSGFTSSDAAAVWTLKLYQEDLRRDWSPENAFWLLLFCCESLAATEVLLQINPEVIHATAGGPLAFDVFQAKIAEGMPDTVLPSLRLLARSGADLHHTGTTHSYGAQHLWVGNQHTDSSVGGYVRVRLHRGATDPVLDVQARSPPRVRLAGGMVGYGAVKPARAAVAAAIIYVVEQRELDER